MVICIYIVLQTPNCAFHNFINAQYITSFRFFAFVIYNEICVVMNRTVGSYTTPPMYPTTDPTKLPVITNDSPTTHTPHKQTKTTLLLSSARICFFIGVPARWLSCIFTGIG